MALFALGAWHDFRHTPPDRETAELLLIAVWLTTFIFCETNRVLSRYSDGLKQALLGLAFLLLVASLNWCSHHLSGLHY